MSTVGERARENASGLVSMLVLGAGFVALFAGVDLFFLVWILGFTVLVPIVAMLFDEAEESATAGTRRTEPASRSDTTETTDALATLRDRYARGDLTDEQFERKLDALLETETPETATEWRTRDRDIEAVHERDAESIRESERT